MGLGKQVRLNRLFAHPSSHYCSVAVDHFIGYQEGLPAGLRDLGRTLETVVAGRPDSVSMHKGAALGFWPRYAGRVPLIIQSMLGRPDDTADELAATPEDAVRLGADAIATLAFVGGKTEAAHVRQVADCVRAAERWEIPVILHTYPRRFDADGRVRIVHEPEDIAWAVRCGIEVGVDIIKVPYTGDPTTYGQIVRECPVPIVAAGGPKTDSLPEALHLAAGVMASGAKGMTIGRNIWGCPRVGQALAAFKAVIHDGATPEEALRRAERSN